MRLSLFLFTLFFFWPLPLFPPVFVVLCHGPAWRMDRAIRVWHLSPALSSSLPPPACSLPWDPPSRHTGFLLCQDFPVFSWTVPPFVLQNIYTYIYISPCIHIYMYRYIDLQQLPHHHERKGRKETGVEPRFHRTIRGHRE